MNNGFKYFSKKLLPNPTKLVNIVAKVFGMSKPTEIFISVKDGLWGSVDTWTTVSGRVGRIPTANDDVYIETNVAHGPLDTQYQCRNLSVASNAKLSQGPGGGAKTYAVFGDFKCWGALESGGSGFSLWLYGYNNYILPNPANPSSFTKGFQYLAPVNEKVQNIMPDSMVPYNSGMGIVCAGGSKQLIGNTSATSFTHGIANVFFELNSFDLSCSTTFTSYANVRSLGNGNIFVNGVASFFGGVNFYNSNRTVELRGGIGAFSTTPSTGIGKWSFTTNNQTVILTNNATVNFTGPVEIGAGLTITNNFVSNTAIFQISGTLDLLSAGSSFINKGVVYWNNPAFYNVTTGTFDQTTFANTVGYVFNGNATLPYTTYSSLLISGTGTKTLGGNTTLNADLISTGILDCSIHNLTVNGATNTQGGKLIKSGAGNILFVGNLNIGNTLESVDFSVGNPTVELRGGMGFSNSNPNAQAIRSGTGVWTFSTNNQTIRPWSTLFPITLDCPIIISGAITVSLTQVIGTGGALNLNNTINGDSASSTLVVGTGSVLTFATAASVPSMTTGIFDRSTFANIVAYSGNYSATIPFNTFSSLTIGGTGTKTLGGSTTLSANLLINNGGQLECSTHNLTVNGTSNINPTVSRYPFVKSGAGALLFVGNVNLNTINGSYIFDLSGGNPTVEFRNGISIGYAAILANWSRTGTGQWSFTTNNQIALIQALTYNCPVLISGEITVTMANNTLTTTFANTINGNNVNSKLIIGANNTINYQSSTQPMATGILDTSTNLNTWIYGLGNQNIKGSPTISPKQVYRNLRFSGSGTTKTLQGFVSVLNTYTLDAGVTVNNNGFTLTNP